MHPVICNELENVNFEMHQFSGTYTVWCVEWSLLNPCFN